MAIPYRADHVGSLLRPPGVLEAQAKHAQGQLSAAELKAIEDKAILEALELQRQVGLGIFSDGEYRRSNWAGDFVNAVDGYVDGPAPLGFTWQLPDQLRTSDANEAVTHAMSTMPYQVGRVVGERLRQRHRLTEHESAFLKAHAPGQWKITLPAASYVVARGYSPEVTSKAYASRGELAAHVAEMVRGEVQALAGEGCPYIQIDNPHYPDYIPQARRDHWKSLGIDPDKALAEDIDADNASMRGIDRSQHIIAVHVCRGNGRSAWHTEGGYDPIAEQVFGHLEADRFLLEYDSERSGGFEALRFMPKGKTVVLGLITTKLGELESQDTLLKRIEEAAKYVAMEDLAISPQCGFASMAEGNLLSWDDQRRKLELTVETARKAWG